ncbi:MAG: hypothetical protein Kow00107_11780 [Planctomycetota bacterium]
MDSSNGFDTTLLFALAPIVLIDLTMRIIALVMIFTKPTKGPKWPWALLAGLVAIIGPIVYFLAGRADE